MSHEKRIANAAGCSHSLTVYNMDGAYAYVKQLDAKKHTWNLSPRQMQHARTALVVLMSL